MVYIIIGIAVICIVVGAAGMRRKPDPSDYINICRSCFEKRYRNTWLGLRLHHGTCQVCHKDKIVDRYPINHLELK